MRAGRAVPGSLVARAAAAGRAVFIAAAAALLTLDCFAASSGRDGFRFMAAPPDARSAAMGGTGVSLAGDDGSMFWNPAALGAARARVLALSHAARAESVAESDLSYVHPAEKLGVGARLFVRRYGDIPGYDASGTRTGGFAARDTLLSLGAGRSFGRGACAGVSISRGEQSIAGLSASATALNAGGLYVVPGWPVTLGLGARNLGRGAAFAREDTPLPRFVDAGANVKLFSGSTVLAVEGHSSGEGSSWNAGTEVWVRNAVGFRAGFDSRRSLGDGFSVGLGARMKDVRLDYAFAPGGGSFGDVHRVSLVLRFGRRGERAYQQGLALAQDGDSAAAILKFKEALDHDPRHLGAARALREAIDSFNRERGGK